ncbi:hypothetical protein LguiA_031136 [Lonicera macranthoides]
MSIRIKDHLDLLSQSIAIMANIPIEIFYHHIFIRLPVKSLLRFKRVCKTWNRLLSDQEFVGMHLNHNNQHQSHKLIIQYGYQFYSAEYDASNGNGIVDLVKPEFPIQDSQNIHNLIGSSNGLLCLVIKQRWYHRDSKILVWNPSTGDFKLLTGPSPPFNCDNHLVGFAYNSSLNDYNILGIVGTSFKVHIYTLKIKSWKIIESAAPCNLLPVGTSRRGHAINGCIYWVDRFRSGSEIVRKIVCFDLKDENFRVLPLPHDLQQGGSLEMKVLGGYLGIIQLSPGVEFNLWAMKNNDKKEEWINVMSMHYTDYWITRARPVCISNNGKVLSLTHRRISDEQKFMLYDPKTRSIEEFPIHGYSGIDSYEEMTGIYSYKEMTYIDSLVSPNFKL